MLCHATGSESCLCVPTEPVVVRWFPDRTRTLEKCSAFVHYCTFSSFQYQTKCLFLVHLKIYFLRANKTESEISCESETVGETPHGPVRKVHNGHHGRLCRSFFHGYRLSTQFPDPLKKIYQGKEKSIWIELDFEHCLWPTTLASWNNVKTPMLTYKNLLCCC